MLIYEVRKEFLPLGCEELVSKKPNEMGNSELGTSVMPSPEFCLPMRRLIFAERGESNLPL